MSFGTVYIDLETSSEGYGWTLVIGAEDNTITRLEHNDVTVHHTVNYLALINYNVQLVLYLSRFMQSNKSWVMF